MSEPKFYKGFIKPVKIVLACFAVIIACGVGYLLYLFTALGEFDKYYSTRDLVAEFNSKRNEIYDAKNYLNKIAPKFKEVDIEFEGNKIARLEITPVDTGKGANLAVEFLDWNIPIESAKADSLLKVLRWTKLNLIELKDKLDKANCLSVNNQTPAKVGFQRSGFGMYSFNIFDKPIPDSLKSKYNDSCTYIYANKYLVLEYGGGAVGPQCFTKVK